MFYYVVFQKEFASTTMGDGTQIFEWLYFSTENKDYALSAARKNNSDAFINITTERFIIYESEKILKKFSKKLCKFIYPTSENPLC